MRSNKREENPPKRRLTDSRRGLRRAPEKISSENLLLFEFHFALKMRALLVVRNKHHRELKARPTNIRYIRSKLPKRSADCHFDIIFEHAYRPTERHSEGFFFQHKTRIMSENKWRDQVFFFLTTISVL